MEEGTVNQMAQAMGRMTNASIMMAGGLEKKRKQDLENHVKRLKEMPEQQMHFSTIGYFLMDELIRHCAFDATAYCRIAKLKQYRGFTKRVDELYNEYNDLLHYILPDEYVSEARRRMMMIYDTLDTLKNQTYYKAGTLYDRMEKKEGHDLHFVCMSYWLMVLTYAKSRVEHITDEMRSRYGIKSKHSSSGYGVCLRPIVMDAMKPFVFDAKEWETHIGVIVNKFYFMNYKSLSEELISL